MATRAQVESILSTSIGGRFKERGVAIDGDSPVSILSIPILSGLSACGITASDPASPSDEDVASVPASSWEKFIDFCYLRALIFISGLPSQATQFSITDYSERRNDDIMDLIKFETARIHKKWGPPANEYYDLTGGMIAVRSGRSLSSQAEM